MDELKQLITNACGPFEVFFSPKWGDGITWFQVSIPDSESLTTKSLIYDLGAKGYLISEFSTFHSDVHRHVRLTCFLTKKK